MCNGYKIFEILFTCAMDIKNNLQSKSNGLILTSEIKPVNIDSVWNDDKKIKLPTVYNLIMINMQFQISYGTQDDSGIPVSKILNTAAVKVEEQNPFYNRYYSGSSCGVHGISSKIETSSSDGNCDPEYHPAYNMILIMLKHLLLYIIHKKMTKFIQPY